MSPSTTITRCPRCGATRGQLRIVRTQHRLHDVRRSFICLRCALRFSDRPCTRPGPKTQLIYRCCEPPDTL